LEGSDDSVERLSISPLVYQVPIETIDKIETVEVEE
jgi:hypothetical protein